MCPSAARTGAASCGPTAPSPPRALLLAGCPLVVRWRRSWERLPCAREDRRPLGLSPPSLVALPTRSDKEQARFNEWELAELGDREDWEEDVPQGEQKRAGGGCLAERQTTSSQREPPIHRTPRPPPSCTCPQRARRATGATRAARAREWTQISTTDGKRERRSQPPIAPPERQGGNASGGGGDGHRPVPALGASACCLQHLHSCVRAMLVTRPDESAKALQAASGGEAGGTGVAAGAAARPVACRRRSCVAQCIV